MIKFEVGKQYFGRFIGDSDLTINVKVTKRTDKSIWCRVDSVGPEKMFRISVFQDCETFYPLGRYSMAMVIRADRILTSDMIQIWSPVLEVVK